jgi:hypothetical protein
MIPLRDSAGRGLFAFSPLTDPDEVLAAVAWAHPTGVPLCRWACPATEGRYCCECHGVAYGALTEARKRREDAS